MRALIFATALIALAPAIARADDLCDYLKAFEEAPFDRSQEETGRRWFEMHWNGAFLVDQWGLSCSPSPNAAEQALCQWLVEHSSFEFSSNLPLGILQCHGYRFPDTPDAWIDWSATIELWTEDGRLHLLEVNLVGMDDHSPAVRYSVFDTDGGDPDFELPPT